MAGRNAYCSGVTDGNTKLPSGIWEFRDSLINRYGSKKLTDRASNHLFEPSVGNQIFQNMIKNETFLSPILELR